MIKRFIAIVIAVVLSLPFSCNVFADNNEKVNKDETQLKSLSATSPYAILLDMKTGAVIYEKNSDERVYPAGLTHIMTAVLVLENCNLEELVTASESALSNVQPGDNKMGILKDEVLSVRQLLYGLLLGSASDAAYVLAEKTSGSMGEFISLMNEKAKELEMKGTNFTNPTGNHDERHYTTASDMASLTMHAMQIPEFCEIVKTKSYSIPPTEKNLSARKITNKNHFVSNLLRNDYYYKNATGIKTGYTESAKSCIAASAEKNGVSLIALVFKSETQDNVVQSFSDCKNMFEYVFDNYISKSVVSQDEIIAQTRIINTRRNNKLILKAEKDMSVLVDKDLENTEITYKDSLAKSVSAPVKENEIIGTREYFLNGTSVGIINLVAEKNYALDPVTFIINKMIAFVTSPWLYVTIVLLLFVFIMAERRRRRILRKKRREARKKRNLELINKLDDYK